MTLRIVLAASFVAAFLSSGSDAIAKSSQKSRGTMTFSAGCSGGDRITIAAVGDLLFHNRLQRYAFAKKRGFRQFWRPVEDILKSADVTYGNLEGPTADGVAIGGRKVRDPGMRLDLRVYGYRRGSLIFNFHPQVVRDLATSGFDIVSTANNHALDRGARGLERTIYHLRRNHIRFTGTRLRMGQARASESVDVGRGRLPPARTQSNRWSTLTHTSGITVGWLACTYSNNGMPDRHRQVLQCYKDRETVLGEIKRLTALGIVDAIMFTPHWGAEYVHRPTRKQRRLAREAIKAGATVVLGGHPHVLQPWEKVQTGNGREGLIIYSLGNFISNMRPSPQRVGTIAMIELTKMKTGQTGISAAGYVPTWVVIDGRGNRVTVAGRKSWARRHARRIFPNGNAIPSNTRPSNTLQGRKSTALPRNCPVPAPTLVRAPDVSSEVATLERAKDPR